MPIYDDVPDNTIKSKTLIDKGNGNSQFIRTYNYDNDGAVLNVVDTDFNGIPYVAIGPFSETIISLDQNDHGQLINLNEDDHLQYLTEARHDALPFDNPHNVTAAQVGAYTIAQTATEISNAIDAHEMASDPHPQYETATEVQSKVDGHANLTNNPHFVTKAQVGLGDVDNTSDLNKPISTATQAALNLKTDLTVFNAHASRHLPSGADPLTTAIASTVSTTTVNAVGTANSFSRSDHTHKVNIINSQAYAAGTTTTTSATDVLLDSMTLTPGAGSYLVHFISSISGTTNNAVVFASIYANGVQVPNTEIRIVPRSSNSSNVTALISCVGIATVADGQAIDIRWRTSAGTVTAYQRKLQLLRTE